MKRILALLMLLIPSINYCPIHTIEDITKVKNYLNDPEYTDIFFDLDKTLVYYGTHQDGKNKVFLVDKRSPRLIQDLQSSGAKVIGLTAREIAMHEKTLRHLGHYGIDFSQSTPFKDQIITFKQAECEHRNGIIYTNHRPKGKPVTKFLVEDADPAEEIIVIDDQWDFLNDIECAIERFNIKMRNKCGLDPIKFMGLHYIKYKQIEEARQKNKSLMENQ